MAKEKEKKKLDTKGDNWGDTSEIKFSVPEQGVTEEETEAATGGENGQNNDQCCSALITVALSGIIAFMVLSLIFLPALERKQASALREAYRNGWIAGMERGLAGGERITKRHLGEKFREAIATVDELRLDIMQKQSQIDAEFESLREVFNENKKGASFSDESGYRKGVPHTFCISDG